MSKNLSKGEPTAFVGNRIMRGGRKRSSLSRALREAENNNFRFGISPSKRIGSDPPISFLSRRLIKDRGLTAVAENAIDATMSGETRLGH